jgi:hypothetical protein
MAVAGHQVEFDTHRRLWFSDIEINAGASYWPFVRLALCRYQPESRNDCHLSRVILSEFVQLLPDRRVEVTIGADQRTLTVEIYGIESSETGVSQGLKTDPMPIAPPGLPPIKPPATQRAGLNEFDLSVEKLDPSLGEDFGWSLLDGVTVTLPGSGRGIGVSPRVPLAIRIPRPVAPKKASRKALRLATTPATSPVVVTGPSIPRIAPLFKATVKLPQPVSGTLRLVVKELELHYEDAPGVFLGKAIARRLVYADTIRLG